MKTPKLLPWYARKAGVSIDRAGELWQQALRDATETAGRAGKTESSGAAMHGFIELLEHERHAARYPFAAYTLLHRQNCLWKLALTVMERVFSSASAHWQRQINLTLRRAAHRPMPACNSR